LIGDAASVKNHFRNVETPFDFLNNADAACFGIESTLYL
jgi:hypothetical protein